MEYISETIGMTNKLKGCGTS